MNVCWCIYMGRFLKAKMVLGCRGYRFWKKPTFNFRVVSDLQISCKDGIDGSHILHPVSLIVNNLSSYGIFVTTKRPTLAHAVTVFAFNENIPFNIFFPLRFKYQNCIVTEVKGLSPLPHLITCICQSIFPCTCVLMLSHTHRHIDTHIHTYTLFSDMLFSSNVSWTFFCLSVHLSHCVLMDSTHCLVLFLSLIISHLFPDSKSSG